MTFDDIEGLVQDAGIQKGIDGAWIGLEEELVAFAEMIEKRVKSKVLSRVPDAWLVQDRATGMPVSLVVTEPENGWLSDCYLKTPLYRLDRVISEGYNRP